MTNDGGQAFRVDGLIEEGEAFRRLNLARSPKKHRFNKVLKVVAGIAL
jgi:hypothetical protein